VGPSPGHQEKVCVCDRGRGKSVSCSRRTSGSEPPLAYFEDDASGDKSLLHPRYSPFFWRTWLHISVTQCRLDVKMPWTGVCECPGAWGALTYPLVFPSFTHEFALRRNRVARNRECECPGAWGELTYPLVLLSFTHEFALR